MRFRLYGGNLHVHRCPEHVDGCDFFDHAPAWMFSNRDDARAQLLVYRRSVETRIAVLTVVLTSIDMMLAKLAGLRAV